MKRISSLILLALALMTMTALGCSKSEEQKESGFDNSKPIPAEDGGGAKS
ncbi:MAG: hypothetical protein JST40_12410 [Armatimonadetes bacterium]|nr:hypothetical protein [Armatimonadota bacterium]